MVSSVILATLLLSPVALTSAVPRQASNETAFDIADLSLREVGARNTLDWRMWLERKGKPISFWHDVPLWPDVNNKAIVNFVVEIPRWTDAKIEINRAEPLNPIFHDEKKELPRFVESVWPHKSYPFLYGSLPQTWENPNVKHEFTNGPGDNDPIDLFDVGSDIGYTGQVKQVKVLGGLAPDDGGETDWKLIGIDIKDPLAALVNSVDDLEKYRPDTAAAFLEWFSYYKVARGDEILEIIGGGYQNMTRISAVLQQGHDWWAELARGDAVDSNEINYNQTSNRAAQKSYVSSCVATQKFGIPAQSNILPAAAKPAKYDQWYYLDQDYKLITVPGSA